MSNSGGGNSRNSGGNRRPSSSPLPHRHQQPTPFPPRRVELEEPPAVVARRSLTLQHQQPQQQQGHHGISNNSPGSARKGSVAAGGGTSATETVRLLSVPVYRDGSGQDPDFYIHRDQHFVHEKAHNPYHTVEDLSSDLYFENLYTHQSEVNGEPGFYLGKLSAQAIAVLRSTAKITVRWESDRAPDYPFPFWHNRFLIGSSV